MAFEVGQRVTAEVTGRRRRTQTAGMRRPKRGVIEEVLRGEPRPRYRIRWDVGGETVYSPQNGGLRAEES